MRKVGDGNEMKRDEKEKRREKRNRSYSSPPPSDTEKWRGVGCCREY